MDSLICSLGPSMVGYMLSIFLCGVCTSSAIRQYFGRKDFGRRTRLLVAAVMLLLYAAVGYNAVQLWYWATLYNPGLAQWFRFTISDAFASIPAGGLAGLLQAVFAERAYKVSALLRAYHSSNPKCQ